MCIAYNITKMQGETLMRLRNIPRAERVLKESPFVMEHAPAHRGKWAQEIFGRPAPIHIEIGMGKGQFLLSLAARRPDISYIGIERYSSVLLRAVEKLSSPDMATGQGTVPSNIRFICMDAKDLETIFAPEEISRIYLNFSDPWPKARHAGRRLTSPVYLERYGHILSPGGRIEFKTDNRELFDFSVRTLESSNILDITASTYDLHHDPSMNSGNIMTEYEEKFSSLDHPICKLIAKKRSYCP